MADLGGLLTKKALVLAKVETTIGTDASPSDSADAVQVYEPDYTIDPTVLERNYVSNDLSPFETTVGRIIGGMEFSVDVRGNGVQNSGLLAQIPKLGILLQGCGFGATAMTTVAHHVFGPCPDKSNDPTAPSVAWTIGGTETVNAPVLYTIEVTTGGASATAEVLITNNNTDEDDLTGATDEVVTTATPLDLGGSGVTVTPAWTGNLIVGTKYYVMVFPTGVKLSPISNAFKTLTLYMYRDGLLFKMLACMGTFTMEAVAGEVASFTFNFSGKYVDPTDASIPDTPVYEQEVAPQVELAQLTWGNNVNLTTERFTLDMQNEVVQRPDVNSPQGYAGSRISSRSPEGGFTPEATHEADEPFWTDFAASKAKIFTARVGKEVGNQMVVFAPRAQTSDLQFDDRDGTMTYTNSMKFARYNGNDELIFVFC